ncbi:hypothetical protein LZD49_23635 [Dyadobacter sp. CY261]|uniref:hypothetical protein n=1 Tax=Dyadobacter sp. CY261 TaxID=2907203 RepID=UPI001F3AFA5C|nr:hypothetical protein [Dyadobacter sp. CY261]MCF0073491.1 hypothetical protein [Dyadobacter sp. CY261]
MKRKNNHIDQYRKGSFPDPEIPADEAWANMNEVLNGAEAGAHSDVRGVQKLLSSATSFKGLLIALPIMLLSAVLVTLFVFVEPSDNQSAPTRSISLSPASTAIVHEIDKDVKNTPATSAAPEKHEVEKPIASAETTVPANGEEIRVPDAKSGVHNSRSGTHNPRKVRESLSHSNKSSSNHLPFNAKHVSNRPTVTKNGRQQAKSIRKSDQIAGHSSSELLNSDYKPVSPTTLRNGASIPETGPTGHASGSHSTSPQYLVKNLDPRPGHFNNRPFNWNGMIKKPSPAHQSPAKVQKSFLRSIHFGPEWNMQWPATNDASPFLFTGADSIKRPARLAIPGFFISNSWNRHALTFSFAPTHTYFGKNEQLVQQLDSIQSAPDSSIVKYYINTNFIKAAGLNFTLQYQYEITPWFSATTGFSYARFSGALFRKESENSLGVFIPGSLLSTSGGEATRNYIRQQQWTIRAGILFHPPFALNGKLQIGANAILPVSNLSQNKAIKINTFNGQLFLRFLIR